VTFCLPTCRKFKPQARFWLWPNLLSLDAPLIAVLWQLLLARDLRISIPAGEPFVLGLCVWFAYLADRVLDALRPLRGEWEPERKTFYRRHLRIAAVTGLCLVLTVVPLAYCFLRRRTFNAGLALGSLLFFYLALVHLAPGRWRPLWPREAAVACLFAVGTLLALWIGNAGSMHPLWAPASLFALLCWLNCSAIETWEWQRNVASDGGEPSRSARWATKHLNWLGMAIAGLAVVAGWLALAPPGFSAAALVSGMALSLLAVRRLHQPVAADLALCAPLLLFAFGSVR